MAIPLIVNGQTYSFPETNDTNWGAPVTAWASAVSNATLQKTGGTFTLTGDANFGSNFGLVSPYLKSSSANIAQVGVVRLSNTDVIGWRNGDNSGNLTLGISGNTLVFTGDVTGGNVTFNSVTANTVTSNTVSTISMTATGAATAANVTASYFKSDNADPAVSGVLRLSNADAISWRNDNNSNDLTLSMDGNSLAYGINKLTSTGIETTGSLTSSSITVNGGTSLTTTNQTGTGNLVLATSPTINSPTFITPVLGAATATSLVIGGGAALTTSNTTGTGNLVLATSPTFSSNIKINPGSTANVAANDFATVTSFYNTGKGQFIRMDNDSNVLVGRFGIAYAASRGEPTNSATWEVRDLYARGNSVGVFEGTTEFAVYSDASGGQLSAAHIAIGSSIDPANPGGTGGPTIKAVCGTLGTYPTNINIVPQGTGVVKITSGLTMAANTTVTLEGTNNITCNTATFGNKLSAADNTVQKALNTLDDHVHSAAEITSGTMATARLGSGTANSTTFLRGDNTWATPAGGSTAVGKNYIINGSMRVAQRAALAIPTSAPAVGTGYGKVDRFFSYGGASLTAGSATQSVSAVPGTSGYAHVCSNVSSSSALTLITGTRIEAKDAVALKNQTVTVSAKVYHNVGANVTYTIHLYKANTADTFSAVTLIGSSAGTAVADLTATTISYSVAAGDCSNGLQVLIQAVTTGAITTKVFYIAEAKLEIGSSATDFQYPSFEEDYTGCLRYFEKNFAYGTDPANGVAYSNNNDAIFSGTAISASGANGEANRQFKVTKRANPTVTIYPSATGGGASGQWSYYNGAYAVATVNVSAGSTGFVGGFSVTGFANYNSFEVIGFWTASSEL